MADTKISALTALTTPAIADKFPLVDDSAAETKHIRHDKLCITGSWTPTLAGSSTAGSHTYTTNTGRYTRIGNLIYINAYILMSAKDGAMAGDVVISGLPFTSENAGAGSPLAVAHFDDITLTGSGYVPATTININSTDVRLQEFDGSTLANIDSSVIGNTSRIAVGGCYIAA